MTEQKIVYQEYNILKPKDKEIAQMLLNGIGYRDIVKTLHTGNNQIRKIRNKIKGLIPPRKRTTSPPKERIFLETLHLPRPPTYIEPIKNNIIKDNTKIDNNNITTNIDETKYKEWCESSETKRHYYFTIMGRTSRVDEQKMWDELKHEEELITITRSIDSTLLKEIRNDPLFLRQKLKNNTGD